MTLSSRSQRTTVLLPQPPPLLVETLPADKTPSLATPCLAPSGFTGQLGAFTVAAKLKVLASSPKKRAGLGIWPRRWLAGLCSILAVGAGGYWGWSRDAAVGEDHLPEGTPAVHLLPVGYLDTITDRLVVTSC